MFPSRGFLYSKGVNRNRFPLTSLMVHIQELGILSMLSTGHVLISQSNLRWSKQTDVGGIRSLVHSSQK